MSLELEEKETLRNIIHNQAVEISELRHSLKSGDESLHEHLLFLSKRYDVSCKEKEQLQGVIENLRHKIHQFEVCSSSGKLPFYSINNEDNFFEIDVIVKQKVNIPKGIGKGKDLKSFIQQLGDECEYMEHVRQQLSLDREQQHCDILKGIEKLLFERQ